jgi:hypothetical protein
VEKRSTSLTELGGTDLGKLYGRRLTVYGGRQQQFQAEGKQRWEVRPVVTNGDMGAVVVHSGLAEVLAVTRGWRWLVMCGQQRGAHKTGKWRTTSAVSGLVVALHRLEAHTAQQQPQALQEQQPRCSEHGDSTATTSNGKTTRTKKGEKW